MTAEQTLDVFIVACDRDIKLFRHFLLSYRLFFKIPGEIHLLIWKKDQELLNQVECPSNLFVYYKDDVLGLVEDDFRNQMYLKLIANKYVNSEWFWVVDADYLVCAPIGIDDFIKSGKPNWFYRPWLDVPEKSWRVGTQNFLGCDIPYLFMDEPFYILNKLILDKLQEKLDVKNILTGISSPSEFVAYGAFVFEYYSDRYRWINSSEGDSNCIAYRVNQRPPSYLVLNADSKLAEIGASKYAVFWSHWDIAESKMRQFLRDAQLREFGEIRVAPSDNPIKFIVMPASFREYGPYAWDGCYSDGWVKNESHFIVYSDVPGIFEIELEALVNPGEEQSLVSINTYGEEITITLRPGVNTIRIPIREGKIGSDVTLKFKNGVSESVGSGRTLYAKVRGFNYLSFERGEIRESND